MLRGFRAVYAALFLAGSAVLLAGCSMKGSSRSGTPSIRSAMVTDTGGLGDRSFNDSAYAGLTRRPKTQLRAEIPSQSSSAADYEPNLTELANEEFDRDFRDRVS